MNKKMRELQVRMLALTTEAKGYMDGEKKDLIKAEELLNQVDELQKEFDLEARLYNAEKSGVKETAPEAPAADHVKAFADAARHGFKGMNEGTPADGGYTVPEDILTQIEHYREAKRSLQDLVKVVPVKTKSGARTFKKRAQQTGFVKVGEGAAIGAKATPQFERLEYSVDKYAGYFPVTTELLEDSDANIVSEITQWAGDESRITRNKLILDAIGTKEVTVLESLDDIKYALNVTLGQAFKPTSRVITNDDGLQFLDTLKDADGKYILQSNPADPMQMQLTAGATTVPLEVIPNTDMPSDDVYKLTADTAIVAGHTYYTRSGSGTAESPYVYSKVSSPVVGSLSSYYNLFAGVPFKIGDLEEGIVFFDRRQMTLKQSDVAVVGNGGTYLNAFEDDLLLIRATEREDVQVRDSAAFVNGQIQILA